MVEGGRGDGREGGRRGRWRRDQNQGGRKAEEDRAGDEGIGEAADQACHPCIVYPRVPHPMHASKMLNNFRTEHPTLEDLRPIRRAMPHTTSSSTTTLPGCAC
jgi:hypothetical protein